MPPIANKTTWAFDMWDADTDAKRPLTRTHDLVDRARTANIPLSPPEVRVLRKAYLTARVREDGKLPGGYTYKTLDLAIRDAYGILALRGDKTQVGAALLDLDQTRTPLTPEAKDTLAEAGRRACLFVAMALLAVPEGEDVSYSSLRIAYDALTGKQLDHKLLHTVHAILGRGLRVPKIIPFRSSMAAVTPALYTVALHPKVNIDADLDIEYDDRSGLGHDASLCDPTTPHPLPEAMRLAEEMAEILAYLLLENGEDSSYWPRVLPCLGIDLGSLKNPKEISPYDILVETGPDGAFDITCRFKRTAKNGDEDELPVPRCTLLRVCLQECEPEKLRDWAHDVMVNEDIILDACLHDHPLFAGKRTWKCAAAK